MCVIMTLSAVFSVVSFASKKEEKIVRVGWYDSPFNMIDENGRRSGYAYDYQQKIAAYTNWKYEYVEGTWSDLFRMLMNGEVDLMSEISYTDERAEKILYPSLPMGSEEYYVFISPDNTEISPDDLTTLTGKRIGVNRDSIQVGFLHDWVKKTGIEIEIIELNYSDYEAAKMVSRGEIDAFTTLDAYGSTDDLLPLFKVGSSDYYFAVNKSRPDLLNELNAAMNRINEENNHYNHELAAKYITVLSSNKSLDGTEKEWLEKHGKIRVGYQDNYLVFCDKDDETGELAGALREFLDIASTIMHNATIEFEPVAYPSVSDAMDALKRGEVDCVFPVNITEHYAEELGVLSTPTVMHADVYAIVRAAEQKSFLSKTDVKTAVNKGNRNYEIFLEYNYPDWQTVYFDDTTTCLREVALGAADCMLLSSYRYNTMTKLCDSLGLKTVSMGVDIDFSFAVNKGETTLYSILARVTGAVPETSVNASLSYYSTEEMKTTVGDFIKENLALFMTVLAVIVVVILVLVLRSMVIEKKANEERTLISATETDPLTGLYNRNFFFEYANAMYKENPEKPMDAIVFDIDRFHSVNELNGRAFGDEVLRVLGAEILDYVKENGGLACRFEGDKFDVYCRHTDDYHALFDRFQGKLNEISRNTSILLRMGVMPWKEGYEPVQQFDRARTACGLARANYKDHTIIFDDHVQEREVFEQHLLNDKRRALSERQFEVFYQPKYDIQCDSPKLKSAEALIRWRHPKFGMISPAEFIPLFERKGQIADIDRFVWEETARQIAEWRDRYGVIIPISVNLSRMDVFDPELEAKLEEILKNNNLDHNALLLEVTESAYTENADDIIRVVGGLRDKGYQIEMDDFGSGYSSLNMLSSMPVDVLKMDSAFIQKAEKNEKDVLLIELILGIAKNLRVPVIAEGVETEAQMLLLKDLGCAFVQGYYFSRPLTAYEFEKNIIWKQYMNMK